MASRLAFSSPFHFKTMVQLINSWILLFKKANGFYLVYWPSCQKANLDEKVVKTLIAANSKKTPEF
ncbi:hypothetical protein EEL32_01460 [Brevibacillus laterosporus]|nr:hypothetical protein EEL31_19860 [Brevibacillus laterosporus]TPG92630.1 hypothetical protein EEL32_01460 [Brevibacillus laterosporus]